MLEATIMFIVFGTILGLVAYYGYQKAKKLPENKGLEPGAILMKSFITYALTYFIVLQLLAMVSEAALLAAVQDESINVTARMTVHILMALIGALGAFALTKYFGAFIAAVSTRRDPGKWIGLVALTFTLACISLLLTIGSPLFNLFAMANSLQQGTQLQVWWASFQVSLGLEPRAYLDYMIAINKLPPNYDAFGSLHSGMVTSLGITAFHITLTFWETCVALTLALSNKAISHAILGDIFDIGGEGDTDAAKSQSTTTPPGPTPPADKDKKRATDILAKLCEFSGLSDPDSWVDKILPSFYIKGDNKSVAKVATAVDLLQKVEQHEKTPGRQAGVKKAELRDEFVALVKDWSGGSLTLPKK